MVRSFIQYGLKQIGRSQPKARHQDLRPFCWWLNITTLHSTCQWRWPWDAPRYTGAGQRTGRSGPKPGMPRQRRGQSRLPGSWPFGAGEGRGRSDCHLEVFIRHGEWRTQIQLERKALLAPSFRGNHFPQLSPANGHSRPLLPSIFIILPSPSAAARYKPVATPGNQGRGSGVQGSRAGLRPQPAGSRRHARQTRPVWQFNLWRIRSCRRCG